MDIDRIIDLIAEVSIKQHEALVLGRTRATTKYGNRLVALCKRLLKFGNQGIEKMGTLLTHENPSARVVAASFLLGYKDEEALATLREVSKGQDVAALIAQETIKRLEEGTWDAK